MTLKEYIAALGDVAAAKKLGISERAARAYRTGARRPRPGTANWIIRKARGELTFEDIYGK